MPTPEEVAQLVGVSKKDQKWLKALVDEILSRPEFVDAFPPRNRRLKNGKQNKPAKKRSRENGHL